MMMMGFGGMMNAGGMGMQNNQYLMQQQMAMQQQPRVGESPFPPPVKGNPYEPQNKDKDTSFKLPTLSIPNADWGEVAYGTALGTGVGAIAGAGLGVANNYANASDVRKVYEIKLGGETVAEQIFEPSTSTGYSDRVAHAHIKGSGVNASVNYDYAPERGMVKRLFRWGNDHDLLGLTVTNNDGSKVQLEKSGWGGNDYKLPLEDGKEVIYRRETNGEFKLHKAILGKNEVIHFDNNGQIKGTPPPGFNADDFQLNKQLGLPEGAKIQTKMPNNSVLKKIEGKAIDGRLLKGLRGWTIGIATLGAVALGGYTAWKTSQPKSAEEILKSLPPQGMPMLPPANQQQQQFQQPQQGQRLNYGV